MAAIGPAIQPRSLRREEKVNLRSVQRAANQSAFLQAPVALFDLGAYRGKRRSAGAGAGEFDAGGVGFL